MSATVNPFTQTRLGSAIANHKCRSIEPKRHLLYVTPSDNSLLIKQFNLAGWEVEVITSIHKPKGYESEKLFNVALMEFGTDLPNLQEIMDWFQTVGLYTKWIALATRATIQNPAVLSLIRQGFYDVHTLPANIDRLLVTLGRAYGMATLHQSAIVSPVGEVFNYGITGDSLAIKALKQAISKVGRTDAPVLISGESGTGKELAARAIHASSSRRDGPCVPVNCGSIPNSLIQSELFGYEKGAFTGANKRQIGKIEARDAADKQAIRRVLTRSRKNLSQAARILGVTRGTLYRLMEKHGISAEERSKNKRRNIVPLST